MATTEKVYVGLDIGTTSISATVIGDDKVIKTYNMPSEADIEKGVQNVETITGKLLSLTDTIKSEYTNIAAIGITGQMHGIVYVDESGRAISPLYTWQNDFGDKLYAENETYCEAARRITNISAASGYGLITDYYLRSNRLVPEGAAKLCTIADYAAMVLTGRGSPLIHPTNAASLGFFDINKNAFITDALGKLGTDIKILPVIGNDSSLVGYYDNIPVHIAVGDNQASFIGALGIGEGSLLINVGTGSQVSLVCSDPEEIGEGIEIRPFVGGRYLKCYSALCGGSAYAVIERFFRSFLCAASGSYGEVYDLLAKIAQDHGEKDVPIVETTFSGTRTDPAIRGSITDISTENFTPANLIYGTLYGIADELYTAYQKMDRLESVKKLAASGNCVRKNPLLVQIIAKKFGCEPIISDNAEEAAAGAAKFAKSEIL